MNSVIIILVVTYENIDSGKVSRAGLFSSTLSSRYDAHTTDSTWVCVFCKQGPHSVIAGDPARPHPNLAGPHIAPGTYTVSKILFCIFFHSVFGCNTNIAEIFEQTCVHTFSCICYRGLKQKINLFLPIGFIVRCIKDSI